MAFRNNPVAVPAITQYQVDGDGFATSLPLDVVTLGGLSYVTGVIAAQGDPNQELLAAPGAPGVPAAWRLHLVTWTNLAPTGTANLIDSSGVIGFGNGTYDTPNVLLGGLLWTAQLWFGSGNGSSFVRVVLFYDLVAVPIVD